MFFSFLANLFNNLCARFSDQPVERELDLSTLESLIGTEAADVDTRLVRQLSEDSFTVRMFRKGYLQFNTDENGIITGFEFTPPEKFEMTVNGSAGDDIIAGADHDDTISGNDGDDTINGNGGEDFLFGGNGNDIINGGADADIIEGGEGDDTIDGGEGNDALIIDAALADFSFDFIDAMTVEITDNNGLLGTDVVSNVEEFVFADGSYTRAELEDLFSGPNVINGTTAGEQLLGTEGEDIIYGDDGADFLYGFGGDDVLNGGSGIDNLTGGDDSDTFVFSAADLGTGVDRIQDFNIAEDAIDISDLLTGFDSNVDAIEDFVLITDNGTHSTIAVDIDGGADSFQSVVTVLNTTGLTDEQALVDNGQLIV